MPGALDHVRVVELGGEVSAPYCTKLLADLGADVVKLEQPEGDPLRARGPFEAGDADVHRGGGLFRYLNQGKRSVVVDGPEAILPWLAWADLVVENLGPGELEAVLELGGAGDEGIAAVNPGAAVVRISSFGQDGPYRDLEHSELTLQAMAGWANHRGVPGRRPVQVGGRIPEYVVASYAACAALTALGVARDLGRPVVVDVSAFESLVGTLAYPMLFRETLLALGLPSPEHRHSTLPGIVRCRDGWVGINALTGQHFQDICALMGADEFAGRQSEIGWGGPPLEAFYAALRPWLEARDGEEIVEVAQAFRIPAAPVGDGRTLPGCAQFRERPFFTTEPGTDLPVPGPAWRLSATPAGARGPSPRLGADGGAAPAPRESAPPAVPDAGAGYLPFAGLRVLDLGIFWAGPYVGLYLGALGADVVKVESVQRPDGFRFSGTFPQDGEDWWDRSGIWQATNLNKRDVTLDLGSEEGRSLLWRLVEGADVVIENFSPRVVEQFGFGYEQLRARNPGLVMLRMPGFGLEGPWRDYVGWAMSIEQASGMAMATGDPDRPHNPGGFVDPVIGMHGAVALQAALDHRRRTGEGQLVEVAQLEVGACLTAEQVVGWALAGRLPERTGNRSPGLAPQGVYPCAEGEWVALSVRHDGDWHRLVEVLGSPAWADDPELLTLAGRWRRHDEIDAALSEWTAERSPAEVVTRMRAAGLPAAELLKPAGMYDEPHLVARGYYQDLKAEKTGTRRYPGWPFRFSFGPAQPHRFGPPALGEHNHEILGGELGLSAAELASLEAADVIGRRLLRI